MTLMGDAFALAKTWPVPHYGIAVISRDGVQTSGSTSIRLRLASVSKLLTAWAVHIAIEEGTTHLDTAIGQDGCTVAHLLAHAGGYPFEGTEPVARPEQRRIYSNTGYDMLAQHVAQESGISFEDYLSESLLMPLGMQSTHLDGSPAKDMYSTVADMVLFAQEMRSPSLIDRTTYTTLTSPTFAELSGMVPGVGKFDPCAWGLGPEIKSTKHPHWLGDRNASSTFGHFGGSGTFLWVDPLADIACVMLSDGEFSTWGMQYWPAFNDAVLMAFAR